MCFFFFFFHAAQIAGGCFICARLNPQQSYSFFLAGLYAVMMPHNRTLPTLLVPQSSTLLCFCATNPHFPGKKKQSSHPHLSLCILRERPPREDCGQWSLTDLHCQAACTSGSHREHALPSHVSACRLCFHSQTRVLFHLRRLHRSCTTGIKVHSRGKWWWRSLSIKACAANGAPSSIEKQHLANQRKHYSLSCTSCSGVIEYIWNV